MKKILWQEMQRGEIAEAAKAGAVVVIPVGSVEQHGEHLPLNTDINTCFSIAKRAAELIDDFQVVVAPPIWMGFSPHHLEYPGTITLRFDTYIKLLTEVASSITSHGFKRIFFLNGHGGNRGAISSMRNKLMKEDGIPSCIGFTWYDLVSEQLSNLSEADFSIGHAGEMETSLQLYLQPEFVNKESASWVPGVQGNPEKATYEKGKKLFEAAIDTVIKCIRDYHSGTLEDTLVRRGDSNPERKKYRQ
ncbi:creatininase family protein [Chloroflexota bacterium]